MTNIQTVRATFGRHFQGIVDVGNGIIRGERQHNGKPYAVAYVDLSDEVVERAHDLHSYQERLIGVDFFSPDNDLRWNSYLFFWAGPKSAKNEDFQRAKKLIESDRHFARKFVLNEHDLERRLGQKPKIFATPATQPVDAGLVWTKLLHADSLAILLEQRPRTATLELIEAGEAFKIEVNAPPPVKASVVDALATGILRKLSIQQFRRVYQNQEFEFGDVNLITAPNGKGKTSLLETIEAFYCGRVRRDPDAVFDGISGEMESPDGIRHTVKLTKITATLKARNMAWYGRADMQAQTISQGFTRFNFLDTDAAFRLSSEQDPEQIQLDLGRLIVGSDTTRLWTFLSKLKADVDARMNVLKEQRYGNELNIDFLEAEVNRLETIPSESTNLLFAFREGVARLRPRWVIPDAQTQLTEKEKDSLTELKSAVDRALAAAPVTPSNKNLLQEQLDILKGHLTQARKIQSLFEHTELEINATVKSLMASRENLKAATLWEKMLLAEVPELKNRIDSVEQRVQALAVALSGYREDTVESFPANYAPLALKISLSEAKRESVKARESLRTLMQALSQAQEFGKTLAALQRDLHETSVAVMQHTHNATECPVCKTVHAEQELAKMVNALIAFGSPQISSGLRQSIQIAEKNSATAQRHLEDLRALAKWQETSGLADDLACGDLLAQQQRQHKDLKSALIELQEVRQVEKALITAEIFTDGWQQIRTKAQLAVSKQVDVNDRTQLRYAIELIEEQIGIEVLVNTKRKEKLLALTVDANNIAIATGASTEAPMLPHQAVVTVKRFVQQAEARMRAAGEIERAIDIAADTAYETLLSEVEACLLAYDKANYAAIQEEKSDSVLTLKRNDLFSARASHAKNEAAVNNLARAALTLSKVVDDHSLETVTSKALRAIQSKVSDIFSQIHSPPEYALGNFEAGQLIVRRDNGMTHSVNQVSTGQRAALALSIFLALNESASTAPPVIIIDDPVAHIDDLNTLSFLDYLRDLVLSSRKQVFFATADARLAALFQRKFEFLGPEKYRRINLVAALKSIP